MFKIGDRIIDYKMIPSSCKENQTFLVTAIHNSDYVLNNVATGRTCIVSIDFVNNGFIQEIDGNDILKELVCTG